MTREDIISILNGTLTITVGGPSRDNPMGTPAVDGIFLAADRLLPKMDEYIASEVKRQIDEANAVEPDMIKVTALDAALKAVGDRNMAAADITAFASAFERWMRLPPAPPVGEQP